MDTIKLRAILILKMIFLCQCNGSVVMIEDRVTENAPLIASINKGKQFSEETSNVRLVLNINSDYLQDVPLATTTQTSSSLLLPVAKDTATREQKSIALSQNSYIRVADPSYLALAAAASLLIIIRRKRGKTQRA